MFHKDLFYILHKLVFLLVLIFILFIITINAIKVIGFVIKSNNLISNIEQNKEINVIQSRFSDIKVSDVGKYRQDIAHTAKKLGYIDALKNLNGSEWGEGINFLLIASDKKSQNVNKGRSDVIIVLRIIRSGKILSISIPRDTLITISDGNWKGLNDKIGHSYYWGGLENLKKSVEILLGSPIYKIITIDNFMTYEGVLAIIGGLDIDKELQGKLGIQWIRNRRFKDGDIERCRRQQVFLKKVVTKMWKITRGGNYIYSIFMYNILRKVVKTDISLKDFQHILFVLKKNKFNPEESFHTCVMPGNFGKYNSEILGIDQLDCWLLDENNVKKMQFLFYSQDNQYSSYFETDIKLIDFLKIDLNCLLKNVRSRYNLNKSNI